MRDSLMKSLPPLVLAFGLLLAVPAEGRAQNGVEEAARHSAQARVRPGDQIALNFLRDRELSQTVTVNERGEATFAKLGTLAVTDLTIAQVQDTLRQRYAAFLREPAFEIAVLRRVVVNGEVRMPNVYMVDPAATLRDVIARAGGLTEYGSRGKVTIVRGTERIRVKDWDTGPGAYTPLQSGDQVLVGRRSWFAINALAVISTAVSVTSLAVAIHRR
jgi:protein involved in polysaccharide export with SLBB domain